MKEIKLSLIPQPGAMPEFLASLTLVHNDQQQQQQLWNHSLPDHVVLEGYTRDAWSWKPGTANEWIQITVLTRAAATSSGRNKVPGFLEYLQQRQKSAYGRFAPRGIWVVSYVQTSNKNNNHAKTGHNNETMMDCRIALDVTRINKCTLQPLGATTKAPIAPAATSSSLVVSSSKPAASPPAAVRQGGSGFLGKLVGAQQRTNHHVAVATTRKPKLAAAATSTPNGTSIAAAPKTAQEVLAAFRQDMQDKMLDFDLDTDQDVLSVELNLAQHIAGIVDTDEKSRVTMEILKYMVYEAAEEVNEEWIAYKEPSEFLDQVVIQIYKEGAAPAAVLEEINKGELPSEVLGQQRALQEERVKQADRLASRNKKQVEVEAHQHHYHGGDEEAEDEEFAALNTKKRDRRTIEDFERERKRAGKQKKDSAF